jgi:hypothetical protein
VLQILMETLHPSKADPNDSAAAFPEYAASELSDLLHAGASLAEIGQVLRHRSELSTAVYAKVDLEALRTLARPWPGSGR